jgi:hypothetical protein
VVKNIKQWRGGIEKFTPVMPSFTQLSLRHVPLLQNKLLPRDRRRNHWEFWEIPKIS